MSFTHRIWFTLAVAVSITAASCDYRKADESPPAESTDAQSGSPEEFDPVFRSVGTMAVEHVVISFARPIAPADAVGKAPSERTRLRIEPDIDGEWRVVRVDALSFEPSSNFEPSTDYRVELSSLDTLDGVVNAPSPGGWVHTFRTKDFELARFAPLTVDYARDRVEALLTFTADVDWRDLRSAARVELISEGRTFEPTLKWERSDKPNTVRAVIGHGRIRPQALLRLSLSDGLRTTQPGDHSAPEAEMSIRLQGGERMAVQTLYAAEGTNGFYIQVVCSDESVEQKRYFYDRVAGEYYGELSARCMVDETEAKQMIHVDPPVDFQISESAGGFRLFGEFGRGSYAVRIDAGIQTVDQAYLHSDYSKNLNVPARAPKVQFVSKGRYLPRGAWRALPIRHINVDSVTLTLRHVPPENLVFWMGDDGREEATERTSNVLVTKEIPLKNVADAWQTTYVDTAQLVSSDIKGLLELSLVVPPKKDEHRPPVRDSARLVLTDMQLVAKRAGASTSHPWGSEIRAWAIDSSTIRPVQDVEVRLVRKSGFTVASCTTGWDGGCSMDLPESDMDPAAPFALVASKQDELTYLKFNELKAEVQQERIAGDPFGADAKYRASVYTDRGVYRPGEQVHLASILRDDEDQAPQVGMPAKLLLVDPRGRTIREQTLDVNSAGVSVFDHDFPAFATTGRYEARLQVAERIVGTSSFQVEEFVPERMKVDVASTDSALKLGDEASVDVSASYLFGGVPANHRVELSCELATGKFSPANSANYHYGVWRDAAAPQRALSLGSISSSLDAEGLAEIRCPGEGRSGGFRGPAQLIARAAVFEAGSGRTSVGEHRIPVHPERFYIGLRSSAQRVRRGDRVIVEGIVVDWQGQPLSDVSEVELELYRLETEYGYYYDESSGQEVYRRTSRPALDERDTVRVVDSKFTYEWTPNQFAGGFLVRAVAENARTDLELEGSGWYYYAPDEERTPRPDKPTWVAIEAPESAAVGDRVSVSFRSPFRGRVLLTAETDQIVASEWKNVDAGDVDWSFRLRDFVPNVYVTAFLVKDPHADTPEAFLPERAFGVRSVRIEPEQFTHALELTVPEEVRSNSTLEVGVDMGRLSEPTFVTVAVVDEGILSLTNFESPDPLLDVFKPRGLGVETFETIGWTLMMPPASPSSTSGGDVAGGPGRVQPVKPVALWSGLVEVPESGKTTVRFDVPQYRGSLRVMAVSSGTTMMGRASKNVIVRDPLMLQTTLPRFLLQGDSLELPVFLTNLSGSPKDIRIELDVEPYFTGSAATAQTSTPIETGLSNRTLTLANEENGVTVFQLKTLAAAGAAKVSVRVSAGELSSSEESIVPILPSGPRSREVTVVPLSQGTNDLTEHLTGWLPMSERTSIWVTNSPYGDAFNHLQYLLRYPYGCIEQTTSSLRPLLFTRDLLNQVDPEYAESHDVEKMVMSGVDRLFSMQTPSGGFAYWPGGSEPTYWSTAYATHTLLDAQKLRYPVSQSRIDDALNWMETQVVNHYPSQRNLDAARGAEPYMHYVLAMSGRDHKARASKLMETLGTARNANERERAYMLKAALYMAGDRRYEADLRELDVTPVESRRRNDWTFFSDRRMRGFMLSTHIDLFGIERAKPLADLVAEVVRGQRSRYYTTQELVWSVTGLGKFVEAGAVQYKASLSANGRSLASQGAESGKSEELIWDIVRASEYDQLSVSVSDKGAGALFAILSSEGVRRGSTYANGGEGLSVSRRFLNAEGDRIALRGGELSLGDVVYVETTIRNTSTDRIANVALVDRIPAGWEIENPRLGRAGADSLAFVDPDALWNVDHLNLRDDRVEVFGHLNRGESKQVLYAVRAVTAGKFRLPPVEAEAMYNPSQWARQTGGVGAEVVIRGPWF